MESHIIKKGILILFFLYQFGLHAQILTDDMIQKKIDHSTLLQNKDKYDKAEAYMINLTEKYPAIGDFWDELVTVQSTIYQQAKQDDQYYTFNYTIKNDDGTIAQPGDSVYDSMQSLLAMLKPSNSAFEKLITSCKTATRFASDAYWSSTVLRIYKFDANPDTNVNQKAIDYYNKAEKEYSLENYGQAIVFYKKAVEADDSFYKARVYLGDAYYNNNDFDHAINVFNDVIEMYPNMIEPRKYLVDSYFKQKNFDAAWQACVDAISVYPDMSLFYKLSNITDKLGKQFINPWQLRPVEVIGDAGETATLANENSPWKYYQQAGDLAKTFIDSNGIFNSGNSLTQQKYLEVYAWEYMLSKSSDASLNAARTAQQNGTLDCYTLIGNFQYDLLPQFQDLVKNNPEKVKAYFQMLSK